MKNYPAYGVTSPAKLAIKYRRTGEGVLECKRALEPFTLPPSRCGRWQIYLSRRMLKMLICFCHTWNCCLKTMKVRSSQKSKEMDLKYSLAIYNSTTDLAKLSYYDFRVSLLVTAYSKGVPQRYPMHLHKPTRLSNELQMTPVV